MNGEPVGGATDPGRDAAGSAFGEARRRLRADKPGLERSFVDFVEAYASMAPLDAEAIGELLRLTYATERVYAEPRILVALALRRGELGLLAGLLLSLSRADPRAAQAFLTSYPRLGLPLAAVATDIRDLGAAAATARGKAAEVIGMCLSAGPEMSQLLLSRLAVVARRSPAALAEIADILRGRGARLPGEAVRRWLDRGTDLMESGRGDEGLRFLLLRSAESRRIFGLNQAVLEEFRSVLRIYVGSLAGRDLGINAVETSMYRLGVSYTDGSTIFLPSEIDWFSDDGRNRRAYSALAALQAASVIRGTFAFDFSAVAFASELHDRYGTQLPEIMPNLRRLYGDAATEIRERKDGEIEAVFPGGRRIMLLDSDHERFFFSFPAPDFARELFRLVENARMETWLGARYAGLAEDFRLVNALLWKRRQGPIRWAEEMPEATSFAEALEGLVQFALAGRWGRDPADDRAKRCLEEASRAFAAIQRPDATVQDSAELTFRLYNFFNDSFRLVVICRTLDVRRILEGTGRPEFEPEIVRMTRPDLMHVAPAALPAPEDEERTEARAVDFAALRNRREGEPDLRAAVLSGEVRIYRYREYDRLRGGYVPNRCVLFESTLPSGPGDFVVEARRRNPLVFERTLKRFLSMKPDEMEITRHWYDGDEMNLSDAVDHCISIARGESPDGKIYGRKTLNRRDLAAAILLDASNSTDIEIGGRRVIDIEKDSLSVLAEALEGIGDPFALFCFNSSGPGRVFFRVAKSFEEGWGAVVRSRIASIEPYESNRDGCAIRHASAILARRPERTKLLLLLSDGIPADVDYGEQFGREAGEYAIEDTRRAVTEARSMGIVPFCFTIDSRATDYIARLYGPRNHAVMDDVGLLPERLSRLYLRLTR